MLFSVVIPVYNKAPHISRALDSVRSQTCSDYEVICINDASTDGSRDELERYTGVPLRILERTTPGPGGYAARNLGIREASGAFVAFLDADDAWSPGHLASLADTIERFPDCDLYGTGWQAGSADALKTDAFTRLRMGADTAVQLSAAQYLESLVARVRPVHTSFACVRRSAVPSRGLFPEWSEAQRGGDLYAWLSIVCQGRGVARSSTIGGSYFKDSVNMVTRAAPSSPVLMSRAVYRDLSDTLNARERSLLKRYFNQQLKNVWVSRVMDRRSDFFLPGWLYWSESWFVALFLTGVWCVPRPLLRRVIARSRR